MKHNTIILLSITLALSIFGGSCPTDVETKTAPSASSYLTVASISSSSLLLQWQRIYSNVVYEVERKVLAGSFSKIATLNAETSSFIDTGLDQTQTYFYRVRAMEDSLVGPYTNSIQVSYTLSTQLLRTLEDIGAKQLAIDSIGSTLVSGGLSTGFSIWNTADWTVRKQNPNGGIITHVSITKDSKTIVTGENTSIPWSSKLKIWRTSDCALLRTIILDTISYSYIHSMVITPDGTSIAQSDSRGRIRLWSVSTGNFLGLLDSLSSGEYHIAMAKNTNLLVGTSHNILKAWNLGFPTPLTSASGIFYAPFLSNDASILAINGPTNLQYYRTSDWTPLYTLSINSEIVAFSPDDSIQIIGNQNLFKIATTSTGSVIRTMTAHSDLIFSIVFFPDGLRFATSAGNQIKIWSMSQTKQWTIVP